MKNENLKMSPFREIALRGEKTTMQNYNLKLKTLKSLNFKSFIPRQLCYGVSERKSLRNHWFLIKNPSDWIPRQLCYEVVHFLNPLFNFKFLVVVLTFSFLLFNLSIAQAEESLSLTITPPLFQLTVGPGEFWASSIKVVNTNPYDLELYATVMDFEAKGESGNGNFIPLVGEADFSYSLASWIEVPETSVLVPKGRSGEIPFSVRVPEGAEPGGHYAAILVGTQPGAKSADGPIISVSSFVSSLIFVRIDGEVKESAIFRQFSSEKTLYKIPEADFDLRLENTGNVHIQPQGDIVIYNMWGKERGRVLVNQKTSFGNVLPRSTRKFEFSWRGEGSVFEIGRYSAIATLSYGEDGRKNISAKTYFWVVPIVPVAGFLGSLMSFTVAITWLVRRYIRRAMLLERERMGMSAEPVLDSGANQGYSLETLMEPLKRGVIDLRSINAYESASEESFGEAPNGQESLTDNNGENVKQTLTLFQFIKKYKMFFLFLFIIILGAIGLWIYFREVLESAREFDVYIKTP